jgi:hypothetical protein
MIFSTRSRDFVTIVLLTFGVLLFSVGWLAGVILLWTSPTWNLRDKILGTLVVPGGLPFAIIVAVFGVPVTSATQVPWLVFTLQVLLVCAPVYTAVHLFRSSQTPARPHGEPMWFARRR